VRQPANDESTMPTRYGRSAIVLETVAAVPGMVGATVTHLKCLRRMVGYTHCLEDIDAGRAPDVAPPQ